MCLHSDMLSIRVPASRHYNPALVGHHARPDHLFDACDIHASELCAELKVIDRRRRAG